MSSSIFSFGSGVLRLMLLAGVPSALDQILWAFGSEQVAEVTGRSQRPMKDASGALRIVRRGASANAAETRAFMAGEKAILIFSDAGGTGRSYHAAAGGSSPDGSSTASAGLACKPRRTGSASHAREVERGAAGAKTPKRRRHYLMEPGWRADGGDPGAGAHP